MSSENTLPTRKKRIRRLMINQRMVRPSDRKQRLAAIAWFLSNKCNRLNKEQIKAWSAQILHRCHSKWTKINSLVWMMAIQKMNSNNRPWVVEIPRITETVAKNLSLVTTGTTLYWCNQRLFRTEELESLCLIIAIKIMLLVIRINTNKYSCRQVSNTKITSLNSSNL